MKLTPPFAARASYFLQKKAGLFDQSYRQSMYGTTFDIPSINGRKTYVSEPWMFYVIQKLFKIRSGCFIDVGVNLGQTLLKVGACDPSRSYLGFEPNSACADYATKLALKNNLNFTIIPAGLSPKSGVGFLQMYRNEDTDPSASLVTEFRENVVSEIPVMLISWNDVPDRLKPDSVAIVKIDVEGGEWSVIQALDSLIVEKRPFILIEVLPPYTADNVKRISNQSAIEAKCKQLDYIILRIVKNSESEMYFEQVDGFGLHGDLALSDYLLIGRESGDTIEYQKL